MEPPDEPMSDAQGAQANDDDIYIPDSAPADHNRLMQIALNVEEEQNNAAAQAAADKITAEFLEEERLEQQPRYLADEADQPTRPRAPLQGAPLYEKQEAKKAAEKKRKESDQTNRKKSSLEKAAQSTRRLTTLPGVKPLSEPLIKHLYRSAPISSNTALKAAAATSKKKRKAPLTAAYFIDNEAENEDPSNEDEENDADDHNQPDLPDLVVADHNSESDPELLNPPRSPDTEARLIHETYNAIGDQPEKKAYFTYYWRTFWTKYLSKGVHPDTKDIEFALRKEVCVEIRHYNLDQPEYDVFNKLMRVRDEIHYSRYSTSIDRGTKEQLLVPGGRPVELARADADRDYTARSETHARYMQRKKNDEDFENRLKMMAASRRMEEEKGEEREMRLRNTALYPWTSEDTPWKFLPSYSTDKGLGKLPSTTKRPADLTGAQKRAFKQIGNRHIFSYMQHTNGKMLHLTIEPIKDAKHVDRIQDWKLVHERTDAIVYIFNRFAHILHLLFMVVGLETHGGTREKGRGVQKESATAKAKKDQKRAKKGEGRNENPKGGGDQDVPDELDLDEIAKLRKKDKRTAADADEAEGSQKQDDELKANELWLAACKTLGNELLVKELEEKIKERRNLIHEQEASKVLDVRMSIEYMREEIERLEDTGRGGARSALDSSKLAAFRRSLAQLSKLLPNVRKGLSHWHIPFAVQETGDMPIDPNFIERLFTNGLVLKCVRGRYGHVQMRPRRDKSGRVMTGMPESTYTEKENRCRYCDAQLPPDHDNDDLYPPRSPIAYGSLRFSIDHGGGCAFEDVLCELNITRTRQIFNNLFFYAMKGIDCPVTRAWLRCVGRDCQRLSFLVYRGVENSDHNQMFKNFIVDLRKELWKQGESGLRISLSDDADKWKADFSVDVPAAQKKKDKWWFIEALRQYMIDKGLLILEYGEAIVRKKIGFYKCIEPTEWKRICTGSDKKNPENTLLFYLAQFDEWGPRIQDYASILHLTPEMKGRLPIARRSYNVTELTDGWLVMFRNAEDWPDWLPRPAILDDDRRDKAQTARFLRKWRDKEQTQRCDEDYLFVDRLLGQNVQCARFFPISIEEMSKRPHDWFHAISKYAKEAEWITPPPQLESTNRAGQRIFLPNPAKPHRSGHWGLARFLYCLEMIRTLLFRPTGQRSQKWPCFYGKTTTGKTSWVTIWIKAWYHIEDICAAKGNFATSDITPNKLLMLLEEFMAEQMSRSNFMECTEVGYVKCEGKRANTGFVDNQTVKIVEGNYFPHWAKDPDSGAVAQRLEGFPCLLQHVGSKDPDLGRRIIADLPHIIKYLAFRDWDINNVVPTQQEMSWSEKH